MTSLIRELRSLVNPLRKPATPPADKTKGPGAGGSGTGGGVTTRGGATTGGGSSSSSASAGGRRGTTSIAGNKSDKDKDDKVEAKVAVKKSEEKDDPRPKSPERKSVLARPEPLLVLDNDSVDAEDKAGDSDAKTTSQTNLTNKCSCGCVKRLEALEGEVSDLKHWKAGRQELDDIISSWKVEVDKWLLSKFGFTVSVSTGSEVKDVKDRAARSPEKSHKSELVTVLSPTSGNFVQEFIDEDVEEDPISIDSPEELEVNDPFKLRSKETEHVEITPDINIFGHFLLENDQDEEDDPEEVVLDDNDDDDDDQSGVAGPSVKTRMDRQIIKMRGDDEYDDTDSDAYSASDESDDSDDSSSGEDYMPENSRGRGRGRPMKTNSQASSTSSPKNFLVVDTDSSKQQTSSHRNSGLTPQTRKELIKQCKPRAGNLWECNVCGFMLASLENMMLHVKYNHSTSTHTCPFCRVVVLCRSPKDAAVHQRTCKMRPAGTDGKVRTPKYSFTPTPSSNSRPEVPSKKSRVEDINAKVNKFIEDILDPSSTATARLLGKSKNNSTRPPAVVTLSSDEDD